MTTTTNPQIARRQAIERTIARRVIMDALKAGYTLSVNDGEEVTVRESVDGKAVLAALMTTDEDYLILHKDGKAGWVRFVYGNDGWDVINDYTVSIEPVLAGAEILAEKLEGK